jgi:shikimate dehydrogenase
MVKQEKYMAKNYRAELVGVFGNPVDENPTGVMEEAAFAAKGLNYRYLTIKVLEKDLAPAMQAVRIFGMRGINLTIPHKVSVLPYLDELTEAAEIIGAVNTVINEKNRLIGENTDGKGFLAALGDEGVPVRNKKILILGAGGAARAIAVECALAGADRITIVNRNTGRGKELAELIKNRTGAQSHYLRWDHSVTIPPETEILINATSIGLFPDVNSKPDIDYDSISADMVVSDVVFNDPHTLFLQEAEKRGAGSVNGLGMLAHQGALNFKLWTGTEAPLAVMESVLKKEFGLI